MVRSTSGLPIARRDVSEPVSNGDPACFASASKSARLPWCERPTGGRPYIITLSNFGMIVIKPSRRGAPAPTVAMLTGGEAGRFLAAVIAGLQRTS